MKLSYIHTLLVCFLPTLTLAHPSPSSTEGSPCGTCIQDNEVEGIAQRWLNAFATGGLHTLDSAVTENIMIYDEGANNGTTSAYVHNRTELYNTISEGPYGGNGVTNVTYDVVFTFHTCDRIALRWQQNEYTTANIGYGSDVPAGRYIEFKGTDLLTIDLASKKVENVTTSADLLNDYRALGYNLGVLNPS
ncbi:MAG: hypothetical protein ALECFALPRED_003009 [Alectoria fallacina]|uniref:NTF2-like domain-containing protein n=1 Tax=Alectoria fallacina TaxID=1903189 RepID=A0A8H3I824_9LECA|nr:MAG: hypothetical protein ALECFALPRED_003009 [Alectoria fallacina]